MMDTAGASLAVFGQKTNYDGAQMFDQLLYLLPAKLQFPHTAKVSEHTSQDRPQTLKNSTIRTRRGTGRGRIRI
jgi:hypothetical protein